MSPGDAAVNVCMSDGKVIAEQAARIAELEAKLADWERRSESCESKLGQLEANEKVIELEAKVQELEAERDAFYMNYRTRCDEETKHLETELIASRQQVEMLAEALKSAVEHLDWIGWGDRYERECAKESGLEKTIDDALAAVEKNGKV